MSRSASRNNKILKNSEIERGKIVKKLVNTTLEIAKIFRGA